MKKLLSIILIVCFGCSPHTYLPGKYAKKGKIFNNGKTYVSYYDIFSIDWDRSPQERFIFTNGNTKENFVSYGYRFTGGFSISKQFNIYFYRDMISDSLHKTELLKSIKMNSNVCEQVYENKIDLDTLKILINGYIINQRRDVSKIELDMTNEFLLNILFTFENYQIGLDFLNDDFRIYKHQTLEGKIEYREEWLLKLFKFIKINKNLIGENLPRLPTK